MSPIPNNSQSQGALLSSMVYHIDKLANPDKVPKPGTLDGVRRMEEILGYLARFFDNRHVSLCPGVVGQNLAIWTKALNDRLRPLYDNYRIPNGFTNRVFLGAESFQRGAAIKRATMCSLNKTSRRGFRTISTNTIGGDSWALESRALPSTHIETWRVNARNMARQFAFIYGPELLDGRHAAIEDLRIMRIAQPRKHTLQSVRQAWGALNHRRGRKIRELTGALRLREGAEIATSDQLRTAGMAIREDKGHTVYQRSPRHRYGET